MTLAIGNVMKKDVVTVDPNLTLAELDRLFESSGISGAPVVSKNRLVGIVSRPDIIRALTEEQERIDALEGFYADPLYLTPLTLDALAKAGQSVGERLSKQRVGEVMSETLISVGADEPVEEVAKKMARDGVHRILVTDSEGHLLGLVSSLDLVRLIWEFGLSSH